MLLRKQGRVLAVILLLVASAAGATIPLDWAALPPLPNPDGVAGIFAGFHNNAVIAAGGANFSEPVWESPKVFHDDIYVLIGREGTDCRWIHGGKLPRPVAYGASASTSRGVVCLGGNDADECFRDAFLMQWQEQEQSVVMQPLPPLPAPCTNSTAAVIRDRVYVASGCTGLELETAQRNFWMLDLSLFSTDGFRWEELPPWPGPSRALAVVAAQHNGVADCVYVMSGRRVNGEGVTEFLRDVYEYMPGRAEPWHYRTDTPRCIMAGTGIALGQSHIFVLSGADETLFYQTDLLKDAHPGFPKEAFAYHTITDTWTAAGTTPANQVTTPAVRWGQDTVRDPVLMISGEIRPRVRTPQVWAVRPVPGASRFGTLDFVMLGIYLAAMVLLGVFFSFRNKNTDDFFRGGQRVPWFVAGLSIFATMLSSITFMAIPAKSYATNWIFFLFNMTVVASAPLVIYLFLPFFRKVDAVSAYHYLEKRFNRFIRQFASASFVFFQLGRMGVVLYLPALALRTITPLTEQQSILLMGVLSIVYCTLGGLEAVVWTDAIQSAVLMGGALFSLILMLIYIDGGLFGFFQTAHAHGKLVLFQADFSVSSFMTSALWVVLLGGMAQNLISYSSDMSIVQRYMSVPDTARAKKAIWTNALACIPSSLLFFGIGTALFVFYRQHPERLDPTFKTDAIFPLFIARELPAGVSGLVVAGLFAAAQSTISTSINSMSTAVVEDFIKPWRLLKTESALLRLGRLLTVLFGAAGVGLALLFASSGIMSLWDQFMTILGLFGAPMCGLFCLGIFTTRANAPGAMIGALAGAAGLFLVQRFTAAHFLLYAVAGIVFCFITGYAASLLFSRSERSMRGLTLYTLDDTLDPDA